MKAEGNQLTSDFKRSKNLFRMLFLFQAELEDYREGFTGQEQIQDLIERIDDLMEIVLRDEKK